MDVTPSRPAPAFEDYRWLVLAQCALSAEQNAMLVAFGVDLQQKRAVANLRQIFVERPLFDAAALDGVLRPQLIADACIGGAQPRVTRRV